MKKKFEFGSENIFKDLEFENPQEMLMKAELARQINSVIKRKKLTKKKVSITFGISESKVLDLESGKLSDFSLEILFRFLNALGKDIIINVKTKARSKKSGSMSIEQVGAAQNLPRR